MSDQPYIVPGFNYAVELVTTTNVITADENGRTYALNSATAFISTLPALVAGLKYRFILKTKPVGGDHTIVTNGSANIIIGTIIDGAGTSSSDTDADTITFTAASGALGDWVEVNCDGYKWYVSGACDAAGGITLS